MVIGAEVHRSFDLGALNDDFDMETLVEDEENGDGTNDCDDISLGSR